MDKNGTDVVRLGRSRETVEFTARLPFSKVTFVQPKRTMKNTLTSKTASLFLIFCQYVLTFGPDANICHAQHLAAQALQI